MSSEVSGLTGAIVNFNDWTSLRSFSPPADLERHQNRVRTYPSQRRRIRNRALGPVANASERVCAVSLSFLIEKVQLGKFPELCSKWHKTA